MLLGESNQLIYRFLRRSLTQYAGARYTPLKLSSPNSPPKELNKSLLARHDKENISRIDRLVKLLQMQRYEISLQDKRELMKCLYPTMFSNIRVDKTTSYNNQTLETIGRGMLSLVVNQTYLKLFKRSTKDICNYDFNCELKMDGLSSWKKDPIHLVRHFLKYKRLGKLARLPIPESCLPERIQYVYDQKAFHAIIGYIIESNDEAKVLRFLQNSIMKELFQRLKL